VNKELRTFSIDDLPDSLVYVNISTELTNRIFSNLLKQFSLEFISEHLDVWPGTVYGWASHRGRYENPPFIRLDFLKRLLDMLSKECDIRILLSDIQRHVVAIKGYGRGGILQKPNLPFQEDKSLIRLILHLIGDGYLPKQVGSARTPSYTNGNKFLRNQFEQILSNVFGDVSECSRSYVDESGKSRSYIAFAKWIGYVIRHWYPDAEFDELAGCLPSDFFQLSFDLKVEMVRTFGDDDGHVGAHGIRFTSGGATILEQIRGLIVELMEATLLSEEFRDLLRSVGAVKPFRSWFIFDVYRPVFGWYAKHVGFSHPERAERLAFQLECDRVWVARGLDGFDVDFLTLIALRERGSVGEVARRFMVREDFLFRVVQRLRKLGWNEKVVKQKFTTFYQTTPKGEEFLERVWERSWEVGDRVVMEDAWWSGLRTLLLEQYGSAAEVARATGMPETTVRGYLQGRRQWMEARWVVALAREVDWGKDEVSKGVVVGFDRGLAPRYEQCDFLSKQLRVYQQLSEGLIGFTEWLEQQRRKVVREEQLLDAGFAEKLQSASVIRNRIIELAVAGDGEITLAELKTDSVLQELMVNRYSQYLADRMAKLITQGVFVRVKKGLYRLVEG
jgi:hypothetical protein